MSEIALIQALQRAVGNVSAYGNDVASPDWANFTAEEIAPFTQALMDAPELCSLWGKWAVTLDSSSVLSAESSARYLVSRARFQYHADVIVSDLLRFAASGDVEIRTVRAITNVEVSDHIQLGDNAYLTPPGSLPPGVCRNVAFLNGLAMGERDRIPPGLAALVVTTTISSLRDAPIQSRSGAIVMPIALMVEPNVRENMEDAVRRARIALIVGGATAPRFGASYCYVSSPGWPLMMENGVGGGMAVAPPPPRLSNEHAENLQRVFGAAGSPDETLSLAIDHLAAARNCQSDAERAIEIGSCLEILLMHEQKSDNSEITNKISHRGAWLIGTDGADRIVVYNTIKSAYGLRSKAVHAGKLPVLQTMEKHEERQQFFSDCELVISRLIERLFAGWPKKWDQVTLSVDPGEDEQPRTDHV